MIAVCCEQPPVSKVWVAGSAREAQVQALADDLSRVQYNLPPGYVPPPSEVFEMVMLRFNLLMDVAKENHESVLSNQAYVSLSLVLISQLYAMFV